jgi:hypothetical protein
VVCRGEGVKLRADLRRIGSAPRAAVLFRIDAPPSKKMAAEAAMHTKSFA